MLIKLRGTMVAALVLFVADAYFLTQFLIAMLTIVIGVPVFLVKLFRRRRDRERCRMLLAKAAVYAFMVVLIIAAAQANDTVAAHRARRIIDACESFRAKTGSYPEKLSELVPGYLDSIPQAKLVFICGDFQYLARPGDHELLYYIVPPYSRKSYLLEQKKWRSLHD